MNFVAIVRGGCIESNRTRDGFHGDEDNLGKYEKMEHKFHKIPIMENVNGEFDYKEEED